MIDKNGKLFGKINIIDLLIILILVAALVFVGVKFVFSGSSGESPATESNMYKISFFGSGVELGVTDNLNEGDPIFEDSTNNYMGTLKSWEHHENFTNVLQDNGEIVQVPVPNSYYYLLEGEIEGSLEDDGFHTKDGVLCVGAHYTAHFGAIRMYVEISSIEPIE